MTWLSSRHGRARTPGRAARQQGARPRGAARWRAVRVEFFAAGWPAGGAVPPHANVADAKGSADSFYAP